MATPGTGNMEVTMSMSGHRESHISTTDNKTHRRNMRNQHKKQKEQKKFDALVIRKKKLFKKYNFFRSNPHRYPNASGRDQFIQKYKRDIERLKDEFRPYYHAANLRKQQLEQQTRQLEEVRLKRIIEHKKRNDRISHDKFQAEQKKRQERMNKDPNREVDIIVPPSTGSEVSINIHAVLPRLPMLKRKRK